MGRSTACFRYLRHSILTSLWSQKLIRNACFLAPIFASGENLSFFLMSFVMDDFEPFVGGVYNVCDDFFDDGGIFDTANNIDNVGVTFGGRVGIDPINDGDVNDEVNPTMFPRPFCGNTVFPSVNDMFRCSVDLPS